MMTWRGKYVTTEELVKDVGELDALSGAIYSVDELKVCAGTC